MLPSSHRLPKEEISNVLRRGIRVRMDALELVYKKTTTIPRFTFVVSTKIDRRATARNRIRRVLSESVRHVLSKVSLCDGVFVARKNIAEVPQVEVEVMVEDILTKAGLFGT